MIHVHLLLRDSRIDSSCLAVSKLGCTCTALSPHHLSREIAKCSLLWECNLESLPLSSGQGHQIFSSSDHPIETFHQKAFEASFQLWSMPWASHSPPWVWWSYDRLSRRWLSCQGRSSPQFFWSIASIWSSISESMIWLAWEYSKCQSVNRKALDLGLFWASSQASASRFPGLDLFHRFEFCWVPNGTCWYPKHKMKGHVCLCHPCCSLLQILKVHVDCLIDSYKFELLE